MSSPNIAAKARTLRFPPSDIWHTSSLTRLLIVFVSFSCSDTSYVIDTGFLQGQSWSGVSLDHGNRPMSRSTWKVTELIWEQKIHGRCIGTYVRLLQWWLRRRLVKMLMLIILQRRGLQCHAFCSLGWVSVWHPRYVMDLVQQSSSLSWGYSEWKNHHSCYLSSQNSWIETGRDCHQAVVQKGYWCYYSPHSYLKVV